MNHGDKVLKEVQGEISFENLTFEYIKDKEVLKDIRMVLVDHVDQVLVNALEIKNAKELFKVRGERGTGIRAQYTGHYFQH